MCLRKSLIQPMLFAVALTVGMVGVTSVVFAEEKKAAEKKDTNAAAKRAWIKICDKVKITEVQMKDDKDKNKPATKEICMTHHESISARTGTPLVSAAVRNVQGHKKERFLVTVPLGMAIPAGVHIKIDEQEPIKAKYTFCHLSGCVAETDATSALVKAMKAGKKMVVATIAISGKPIGFPVPLSGFGKAYDGKPIDGDKYASARKKMMQEIRKRQVELAKKMQADKAKKAAAPKK